MQRLNQGVDEGGEGKGSRGMDAPTIEEGNIGTPLAFVSSPPALEAWGPQASAPAAAAALEGPRAQVRHQHLRLQRP